MGSDIQNPQLTQLLIERNSYISNVENTNSIIENLKKIYSQWQEKTLPFQNKPPITVKMP